MAAENAELYQEVQDKHDEVLSSAALAHNGYIFATQGDAFELVFPTIGDAVRFCLEGQEALLRTQWSSEALDLPNCGAHESKPGERAPFEFAGPRVRMGIHAASLASRGDGGDEDDPPRPSSGGVGSSGVHQDVRQGPRAGEIRRSGGGDDPRHR